MAKPTLTSINDIIARMETLESHFVTIDSGSDMRDDFERSEKFRAWAAENPQQANEYRALIALYNEADDE